ncbi:hypothetical protein [Novosphingobium sp. PASSN1]|nr:hypothetical protein [Novosphingobium sp. PASSN1]
MRQTIKIWAIKIWAIKIWAIKMQAHQRYGRKIPMIRNHRQS